MSYIKRVINSLLNIDYIKDIEESEKRYKRLIECLETEKTKRRIDSMDSMKRSLESQLESLRRGIIDNLESHERQHHGVK